MICKHVLLFGRLSFHFLGNVHWRAKVLNCDRAEVQFTFFSFVAYAFGVISKNSLWNPRAEREVTFSEMSWEWLQLSPLASSYKVPTALPEGLFHWLWSVFLFFIVFLHPAPKGKLDQFHSLVKVLSWLNSGSGWIWIEPSVIARQGAEKITTSAFIFQSFKADTTNTIFHYIFLGQVIFYCVYAPHLLYPIVYWWTLGLLLYFGSWK